MINSMTGYGQADGTFDDTTYLVEIRAVNNRYFKTRLKLPDSLAFLEDGIEKLLQSHLARGSINYNLRLKNISASELFDIDETALRSYTDQLAKIASSVEIKSRLDVVNLLNLPGIMTPVVPEAAKAQRIKENILSVTERAIVELKKMRAAEGQTIADDFDTHCGSMLDCLEKISGRSSIVLTEYQKKLSTRVDSLLTKANLQLDSDTLAREVAIYADRCDISEEISRLRSHLEQFRETSRSNTQAGRKLDFITQEMLREANTIASKSGDTEIIHYVVEIKCLIDRIKEQVQNVE
ncbi:YicC/YloC family endoribonuclease [Planctomycetota bacterium]